MSQLDKKNFFTNEKLEIPIQKIISGLLGLVYWKNDKGIYLGCNDMVSKKFGLKSPKDIIGKTDFDLFSKEKAMELQKNDLEVIRTNSPLTFGEFDYISRKIPLHDKAGNIVGILGISIDFSDYKERILQQNEILDEIIAVMPGHVYWKDLNCRFLGCNDAQAIEIGLKSRNEIIGLSAYDAITNTPSEKERKRQANLIDNLDKQIMKTGIEKIIEEPLVLKDNSVKIFISHKIPLRDKNHNIVGLIGISLDITEQEKIKETLKKAEGQIQGMTLVSASIAHELRTPLASIKSALYTLKNIIPKLVESYHIALEYKIAVPAINPQLLQGLDDVISSVNKQVDQSNMVIDMLLANIAQTNIQTSEFTECSIAECIKQALNKYIFKNGEKKFISVNTEYNFKFLGKEILIVHILLNLLKNAFYFIHKVRKGEIKIWTEKQDKQNILYFMDTGQGILPENLSFIFEQFFSKETHHGTGIGLAFSKMVMEAHRGSITCESVYNKYTKFVLVFPALE